MAKSLGFLLCLISLTGALVKPCLAYETTQSFTSHGSTITVRIKPEPPPVPVAAVLDWVKTAAGAVTAYYGRFPVPDVHVTINTGDRRGRIHHGVTYRGRGITIDLGQDTRQDDFAGDWELTHEMFHLSFPLLDDQYDWMGEGLSDYMEPIARARIGKLSDEKVWKDMVEGLPKGLPQSGDQGLDRTHKWGRIYWGGVIYWLSVDLEIRRRSQNRHSLHEALQAILDAGGNGRHEWSLEEVLDVGDKGAQTTALRDVHDQMGEKPFAPDLGALWDRLGVVYRDGIVSFNDQAPEAALRKSITHD